MASFSYQCKNEAGQTVKGQVQADNAGQAAAILAKQGLIPLKIEAVKGASAGLGSLWAAASTPSAKGDKPKPVSETELQMFTRELYALQKAGVPIMRALELLRDSTASQGLRDALTNIRNHLDSGLDLPTAFDKENQRSHLFTPYYLSLMSMGNQTGRLTQCLKLLNEHLSFQREAKEQMKTALRYPVFVIGVTMVALVIVNIFVIPQFAGVFKKLGTELPIFTRILMGTSDAMIHGWPVLVVLSIGGWFGVKHLLKQDKWALRADNALLRMPIFGDLVRRTCLARIASALAISLEAGIPVVDGLDLAADNAGNLVYRNAVKAMKDRVMRGEALRSAAASTGQFPPALLQSIAVGEETGALEELLGEMAGYLRGEVSYALTKLSSRLEPILIMILGAIVLVLALGIFLPMWNLGQASFKK